MVASVSKFFGQWPETVLKSNTSRQIARWIQAANELNKQQQQQNQ